MSLQLIKLLEKYLKLAEVSLVLQNMMLWAHKQDLLTAHKDKYKKENKSFIQ